jgi:Fe-S-cluster containining protein
MPHKLRDGKAPGSRWSTAELAEPGRCIFYDRGRCSIYPVRPFECARMHHEHSRAKTARLRAAIAKRWSAAKLAPFLALVRAAGRRSRSRQERSSQPGGPR